MKFRELSNNNSGGSGIFLKIEPGSEVVGVLRGEPVDFRQHWVNGKTFVCKTKANGCEYCSESLDKETRKTSFRFKINFVIKENGAYVAKILSAGGFLWNDLRSLAEDYDLSNHAIKIKRTGEGTNTRYSVVPVPNGTLTEEAKKVVEAVKLNEL